MSSVPAQPISRIFFRMLGYGIAVGALLGMLAYGVLFYPGLPTTWDIFFIFLAALIGGVCALLSVLGATLALVAQSRRRVEVDGVRQALVAALGSAAGSLVPAVTYIAAAQDPPGTVAASSLAGLALVAVSFVAGFCVVALLLNLAHRQDQQLEQRR